MVSTSQQDERINDILVEKQHENTQSDYITPKKKEKF